MSKRVYRGKYSSEDLLKAVHEVSTKKIGFNQACIKFDIPKPTLKRHLDGQVKRGATYQQVNGRLPVLDSRIETELSEHLRYLDDHYFGLTIKQVCKLVYEIAEKNGLPHPFNRVKKEAGKKWFYNFRKRHPELSLRSPENTSIARLTGFNETNVYGFFDKLEALIDEHKFDATTIFNMDESGFSTVQKKAAKVLSTKGKRRVGTVTSGERGVTTTFVCCANATGFFVPPMIIYKRARDHPALGRNKPPGSLVKVSESGYINSDLFVQWLEHFISHVRPSTEKKVLLLLDGHTTHSMNLKAINLARENGIILLQLPAHTTHRLQPLDVGIFGPLQK